MSRKAEDSDIYTNIEAYVAKHYSALDDLFRRCDLYNVTKARPGGHGITLLIPKKDQIDAIRKYSVGLSTEEVSKACQLLLAHIVRKAIIKPADWMTGDVSDARFPSQLLQAKVAGNKVELLSGGKAYATLEPDPNFRVAFRTNVAVWVITDGRVREEMDSDAPRKPQSRARKPQADKRGEGVSGGYELSRAHAESDRFKIGLAAENEFVLQHARGANKELCTYVNYVIAFAHFMYASHRDVFFQCVLPLIRFRVSDFYVLFEPHRVCAPDQYLIDGAYINEWWSSYQYHNLVQNDVISFRKWIDERLAEASSVVKCAIYDNPKDLIAAIDSERMNITDVMQTPAQIADAVYKIYDELSDGNRIGDIPNIYPPMLAEYYRRHPRFKLMHDELAYVTEPLIIRVCHNFDVRRFREIVTIIGNAMHADSVAEVENMLPLINRRKLALQNDALINEIRVFINSTMFFWIPLTRALVKDYPITNSASRPANTDALYNTDLALALHHERIYGDQTAYIADKNRELALAALGAIPAAHISAELQAKLKAIIQQ